MSAYHTAFPKADRRSNRVVMVVNFSIYILQDCVSLKVFCTVGTYASCVAARNQRVVAGFGWKLCSPRKRPKAPRVSFESQWDCFPIWRYVEPQLEEHAVCTEYCTIYWLHIILWTTLNYSSRPVGKIYEWILSFHIIVVLVVGLWRGK